MKTTNEQRERDANAWALHAKSIEQSLREGRIVVAQMHFSERARKSRGENGVPLNIKVSYGPKD